MKLSYITLTAAALALLAMPMSAQSLSREQAIEQIKEHNLRLKALAEQHKSEATALSVAGRFSSQPEVEFEHLWGPDSNRKWNVGVAQSFDWPGVYRRRAKEAKARIGAFEYLYQAEAREVALEAALTIDNAIYVHKQIELNERLIAGVTKIKDKVSEAYKHGQVTLLDVKKLDFELYTMTAKRAVLNQQMDVLKEQLAALNGGNDLDVDLTGYMPRPLLSLEQYLSLAVENNPSVKAAMQNAEAARLASRTASAERLPGFSLGYRHAYEEHTHFNGLAVGISIPVFTNKAAANAADIQARSLGFEASEAAAAAKSKVKAAYADATRRAGTLREMSKVVLDNTYPDLLLMAYNGGQINVITYLQELSYFESAQTELLAAEYAYVTNLTTLHSIAAE